LRKNSANECILFSTHDDVIKGGNASIPYLQSSIRMIRDRLFPPCLSMMILIMLKW
jgi:hypothetical protein